MPGFTLTFTLVAAAAFIAGKNFGGKDDDPTPSRDSYYPSSSYSRGTTSTRTPTQQSYGPPPPSATYTSRPPATNAHSQTTAKTPAPPDYGRSAHHPSVASPYTRTPSQTQPPSILTQPSSTHASPSCTHRPPETYAQTTPRTPALPDYARGVYHSTVVSPCTRTPSQIQPSSAWTPASRQPSLPFNTVHVYESPEYEYFHTGSHVPSRVHTGSEPRLLTVVEVISSDLRSDKLAGVEGPNLAKKLRDQARRERREMSEACSRAKSAQKKRSKGAAQAHRQEAIAHESAIKVLNKRAAKIIFRENNRENNKNRSEGGRFDLHGLRVPEAIQFAKDQVKSARSRGDESVRFIVGKGLHSDAGGAKIRPALQGLFTKRGLSHSLDPKNAGVIIVRLD